MHIRAEFVLRLAGADNFSPIENAKVMSETGEEAMHKYGGFYVFLRPLRVGSAVFAAAPGYEPETARYMGDTLLVLYLKSIAAPSKTVTFFAGALTKKGDSRIKAAFVSGNAPKVLNGCNIKCGDSEYIIAAYDSVSGVITTDKPLIRDIRRGDKITLIAR